MTINRWQLENIKNDGLSVLLGKEIHWWHSDTDIAHTNSTLIMLEVLKLIPRATLYYDFDMSCRWLVLQSESPNRLTFTGELAADTNVGRAVAIAYLTHTYAIRSRNREKQQ